MRNMRLSAGFVSPSPLEAAFQSGDEDRLIRELRKVKSQKTRRALRASNVVRILRNAKSPRVRNAAAIALADMHAQNAKHVLIEMLANPVTKGSRGTLLYALRELRAVVPPKVLIEAVINDSYEASAEALGLLADQKLEWSSAELDQVKSKLRAALETAGRQRSNFASRALAYLSDRE